MGSPIPRPEERQMSKYQVRPIADEHCDALNPGEILLATDDLQAAKDAAAKADHPFGAGIEDMESGQIDVGFGFGVPCPDVK